MTFKLNYLDNASTSKKLNSFIDCLCSSYRTTADFYSRKFELLESLLINLSSYLGMKEDNITLVPSSTYAINELWQWIVDKNSGTILNIYISQNDHISNISSILYFQNQRNDLDIKIHYFNSKNLGNLQFEKNSYILLTVLDNLGLEYISVEDVEKLRNQFPSVTLIGDLTQYMPYSEKQQKIYSLFDYFYFSAHKWLGPFGLGVIVSPNEFLDIGLNLVTFNENNSSYSLDWRSIHVWNSSFNEIQDFQLHSKKQEIQLREYWKENFPSSPYLSYTYSEHSLIFLVGVHQKSWHDLAFFLESRNIVFRAEDFCSLNQELKGKHLRFSLSTLNSKEDISHLFNALSDFCKLKY